MITESNGREVFIGKSTPWEIDQAGRLVLSLTEAKHLREHLALQKEATSTYALTIDGHTEDG